MDIQLFKKESLATLDEWEPELIQIHFKDNKRQLNNIFITRKQLMEQSINDVIRTLLNSDK